MAIPMGETPPVEYILNNRRERNSTKPENQVFFSLGCLYSQLSQMILVFHVPPNEKVLRLTQIIPVNLAVRVIFLVWDDIPRVLCITLLYSILWFITTFNPITLTGFKVILRLLYKNIKFFRLVYYKNFFLQVRHQVGF